MCPRMALTSGRRTPYAPAVRAVPDGHADAVPSPDRWAPGPPGARRGGGSVSGGGTEMVRRGPKRIRSGPRGCGAACWTRGPRRPPVSARTPTPSRTWRSAATATGSSSSWPRTPPTPPPAPGVPGRLRLTLARRRARRRQHRRAAGRRGRRVAVHAARLRQAGRAQRRGGRGRFGVGFSAVLAVSDEPAVVGPRRRRALVAGRGARAGPRDGARSPALARRAAPPGGPRAAAAAAVARARARRPRGYDTAVVLPLRDARGARSWRERLLAAVDDALLLTLPGLAEVVVEHRRSPYGR